MKMENINTELERKLYVEIMGFKRGFENYLDFAKDNGYEDTKTFKGVKMKLELVNKLAQIIEEHEK
jgi:hypothetical protein